MVFSRFTRNRYCVDIDACNSRRRRKKRVDKEQSASTVRVSTEKEE
jgi:hypothetical protein